MNTASPVLGILGGMGPLCGAYFYQSVIEWTAASQDCDHISVLVDGSTTTPDRTAFLCGQSQADPLPSLVTRALRLGSAGADLLALPCNTAHSFYQRLCDQVSLPILHIIAETTAVLCEQQIDCVGILCTDGTRSAKLYDGFCGCLGIRCLYPSPSIQGELEALIYRHLKGGALPCPQLLEPFVTPLLQAGAQKIVTACTELSLCLRSVKEPYFVDSLTVLAQRSVLACGKELRKELPL